MAAIALNSLRDQVSEVVNPHNRALKLDDVIARSKQLGWLPCVVKANTIANTLSQVIVPWFTRGFGGSFIERLLYPMYVTFTLADDAFGRRLKTMGKDVLIAFQRDTSHQFSRAA
jgi:hypothetical protein